jgi:hypothetical protein
MTLFPVTALILFCAGVAVAQEARDSTKAARGVYFSESVGPSISNNRVGLGGRVGAGYRVSDFAYEAWVGGSEINTRCAQEACPSEVLQIGFDIKYLQPVSKRVETYLRGGVAHESSEYDYDELHHRTGLHASGLGVSGGIGIQVKGKVTALGFLIPLAFWSDIGPKVTIATFVEAGVDVFRLRSRPFAEGPERSIYGNFASLRFGVAFGSDF